jgi:hypothetical protein
MSSKTGARRNRVAKRYPVLLPWFAMVGVVLANGCAQTGPGASRQMPLAQYRNAQGPGGPDAHVPDFVTRGFEPFSRMDAIAIAMREWRLFGEPVDDDDPEQRPDPATTSIKPERLSGLWERVGEYWWIGQDPYEHEVGWTGKHGSDGRPFNFEHDGLYAWSAAFICYVMRIAGAGTRFPYSPNHATYINAAASGQATGLRVQDPASYAPVPGDLICAGRGASRIIQFHNLPTRDSFPAHCGLVVSRSFNQLSIIGGNVDDAVTLTHVPTGPGGLLAAPGGASYDSRYSWCVVLQVLYDTDGAAPADN